MTHAYRFLFVFHTILLLSPTLSHAQPFAFGLGSNGSDRGYDVVVDAAGNSFVTGFFQNTVDFDPGPGTFELTSNGAEDIFVASYDRAGVLRFAIGIGGNADDIGFSIDLDDAGNSYVTGYFRGTVDFDPGAGLHEIAGGGSDDLFVASFDDTGALRFAFGIGATGSDRGHAIAVDGDGNSYVTGIFRGLGVDFDPGADATTLVSQGHDDLFVASYDTHGALRFAVGAGGSSADRGFGIAIDEAGNSYVTGHFFQNVDFDPSDDVHELTSTGSGDIFLASYDDAGNLRFANGFGAASGNDSAFDLAVDAAGNSFLTGYFRDTVDFDPGSGITELTSLGNEDIFVASYNTNGALRFVRGIGGITQDEGEGITVDAEGNSYVTGVFHDVAHFYATTDTPELPNAGGLDVFIASYDPAGELRFAESFGGHDSDFAAGIAVDRDDRMLLTGFFIGTTDFDPGAAVTEITSDGMDLFVTAYDRETSSVAIADAPDQPDRFHLSPVYPNPFNPQATVTFSTTETMPVSLTLYDLLGRPVRTLFDGTTTAHQPHSIRIDGAGLTTGMYLLRLEGDGISETRQAVLLR